MSEAKENKALSDLKRNVNAPCVFLGRDERNGEKRMFYPAVNCEFGCDACGWNPEERRRRLKTGRWKPARCCVSPVTGKVVALPAGVVQLRFRQNRE